MNTKQALETALSRLFWGHLGPIIATLGTSNFVRGQRDGMENSEELEGEIDRGRVQRDGRGRGDE